MKHNRLISLASSCCKILQPIMLSFISEFLKTNSILSEFQQEFRKDLSTTIQLVTTTHEISQALDSSSQIDFVFLDFSEAFDRVASAKLLARLSYLGLPAFLMKWIKSYLTNRTHFVEVDGCACERLAVTSGVPQGSVSGPVVFFNLHQCHNIFY